MAHSSIGPNLGIGPKWSCRIELGSHPNPMSWDISKQPERGRGRSFFPPSIATYRPASQIITWGGVCQAKSPGVKSEQLLSGSGTWLQGALLTSLFNKRRESHYRAFDVSMCPLSSFCEIECCFPHCSSSIHPPGGLCGFCEKTRWIHSYVPMRCHKEVDPGLLRCNGYLNFHVPGYLSGDCGKTRRIHPCHRSRFCCHSGGSGLFMVWQSQHYFYRTKDLLKKIALEMSKFRRHLFSH